MTKRDVPNIKRLAQRLIAVCTEVGSKRISANDGIIKLLETLSEEIPFALSDLQINFLIDRVSFELYPQSAKYRSRDILDDVYWKKGCKQKKLEFCRLLVIKGFLTEAILFEQGEVEKVGIQRLEEIWIKYIMPPIDKPFDDHDPYF